MGFARSFKCKTPSQMKGMVIKPSMKNNLFTGKSTRTKIFTVISVAAIILLFVLSLFLTSFGIFGNAYLDLTPEGLYTLTPNMKKVCEGIFYMSDGELRDPGIKITFCDDPDNLIQSTTTRLIYYMARAVEGKFSNCEVETVNVRINPTSVAKYKTTSLTEIKPSDIIVSYGSRYSIVSADQFWHVGSDNKVYAFDGEYKLASVMLSLTLVDRPVAYFVTDHGETYYDVKNTENEMNRDTGSFADLLMQRGFEIKNLSLSKLIEDAEAQSIASGKTVTPKIPEDCVLLVINNPREDFKSNADKFGTFSYVSETDLLDKFMMDNRGSIMVSLDYEKELPNFEDFLAEWGIECTDTLVKDNVNSIDDGLNTTLIADYNFNEETYAYAIYGDYASRSSSPRVIIENTGAIISSYGESEGANEAGTSKTSRIFTPFLYSSKEAKQYGKNSPDGEYSALAGEGQVAVAAIGGRQTINEVTGEYTYAYIFCAASPDFFSTSTLGNATYANFDVISALVQNIARLETHASELGGLSYNNSDDTFLGKMLMDESIKEEEEVSVKYDENGNKTTRVYHALTKTMAIVYAVVIMAIPLAIAAVGIVIHIKRKYL